MKNVYLFILFNIYVYHIKSNGLLKERILNYMDPVILTSNENY